MERVIDIRVPAAECRFIGVEINEPIVVIHGGVTICRGCSSYLSLPTPIRGFYVGHLVGLDRNWEDEVKYERFYKCPCGEKLMSARILCGKPAFTDALFDQAFVEIRNRTG